MVVEVAQYVAAETLLAELLEDDREQAAVPAGMVDDDELGWLAIQRRKQGGVVEPRLNLIPTGQVVPELHDYLGIIANEVVEQEGSRPRLVHIADAFDVAGGERVHSTGVFGQILDQRLSIGGFADRPDHPRRLGFDQDSHIEAGRLE